MVDNNGSGYSVGTEIMEVSVKNVPTIHNRYVVARVGQGELWFWGSYDDLDRAREVAYMIPDGVILE